MMNKVVYIIIKSNN